MKEISRNDSCWCGSAKKYKYCHYAFDNRLRDFKNAGYPIPNRGLIKTSEQVEGICKSAEITTGILDLLEEKLYIGMQTKEIDKIVYDYTIERGGVPATLDYHGYKYSCCVSINHVICHGMPDETRLKEGDIVNIDISTVLNQYFSDSSRMYMMGETSQRGKDLVACARECLKRGIEAVKPYESIDKIAATIEPYANSLGYSVVRDLGGHGTGLQFHEDPHVHHFVNREKGMIMAPGMVFTVEPMINEKSYKTETLEDNWTVVTVDGGLSAQWEHTVLVTEDGVRVLT